MGVVRRTMVRLAILPPILAGTALALALGAPALAQQAGDVNSFSLPPGPTQSAAPPIIVLPPPRVPAPTAVPTPSETPAATPSTAPATAASPSPAPRATRRPAATPSGAPTPAPAASPPAASPTVAPPVLAAPTEFAPTVTATPSAPETAPSAAPLWPWLAGGGVVLLGGAAALLLRRRKVGEAAAEYYEEEPAYAPPAGPEPSPPAALTKRPEPAPQPAPARQPAPATQPVAAPPPAPVIPEPALSLADLPPPPPEPAPAPAPAPAAAPRRTDDILAVELSARRLSATLMNTALTYELTVTNTGPEAIGPFTVTGDMIGAHASIPPKVLLETSGEGEPQHRVPRLEPGESAAMSGELRLPLAAITPIRHGTATLFVPLARFRVLVFRDGRPPVSANHAFVVGEEPATAGAALKPFRLDLGPRLYSSITQRELALPG